jgi:hypothetical protein
MKVAFVVVPYIVNEKHFFFATQTLDSLRTRNKLDRIAIVNALNGPEMYQRWLTSTFDHCEFNDRNNVARAWNKGIHRAFDRGADLVIVSNLDLTFHPQAIDNLVEFTRLEPNSLLWSGQPWTDLDSLRITPLKFETSDCLDASMFALDRRLFDLIGEFDEQFEGAYHEDKDMIWRIKLAGQRIVSTSSSRYFHVERATLKALVIDEQIAEFKILAKQVDENLERYLKKWGGKPNEEVFRTPYNR